MTLGEKIRYARKNCGLSQGQLAEKLCVSRSAIAKWETDKGMPDVENLKTLSRLLQVSVDSLLDDSADSGSGIRETYNLAAFGRGCKKVKKDRMMGQRFPGATIHPLLGRPELPAEDGIVDRSRGFLTPLPFGASEYLKSVKELDRDFYLVEQEDEQLFVTVTDEFLQIHPMRQKQAEKAFRLGNWYFILCDPLSGI